MGNHLRIGLGAKPMALRGERLSKLPVVLDDPVVDDREVHVAVRVRMGIGVRRAAMRGPAGVTDADVAGR